MPLPMTGFTQVVSRPKICLSVTENSLGRPMMDFSGSVPTASAACVQAGKDFWKRFHLFGAERSPNKLRRQVKLTICSGVLHVAHRTNPQEVFRSVGKNLNVQ